MEVFGKALKDEEEGFFDSVNHTAAVLRRPKLAQQLVNYAGTKLEAAAAIGLEALLVLVVYRWVVSKSDWQQRCGLLQFQGSVVLR